MLTFSEAPSHPLADFTRKTATARAARRCAHASAGAWNAVPDKAPAGPGLPARTGIKAGFGENLYASFRNLMKSDPSGFDATHVAGVRG